MTSPNRRRASHVSNGNRKSSAVYAPPRRERSTGKAIRATVARTLFAIHSFIAIWRLWTAEQNSIHLTFCLIPCLLFVEGAVAIYQRNSDEYKWFCPCVFIFLCGSVPPIWFLEIGESQRVINLANNISKTSPQQQQTASVIISSVVTPKTTSLIQTKIIDHSTIPSSLLNENLSMEAIPIPMPIELPPAWILVQNEPMRNQTDDPDPDSDPFVDNDDRESNETLKKSAANPIEDGRKIIDAIVKQAVPLIDPKIWLQAVEQSLLVILVIGRWILPKGQISRDQLSQLLLAYIAISSDIVELFNVFNEEVVRRHLMLTLIVLCIWSVSLIQYALVVTTLSAKKVRPALSADGTTSAQKTLNQKKASEASLNLSSKVNISIIKENPSRLRWWERTDVWGIVMTIFLQDGPFFGLRVYLICWLRVTSYTMLFFVAKNSLIISVQIYRLIVLCCEVSKEDKYWSMQQQQQQEEEELEKQMILVTATAQQKSFITAPSFLSTNSTATALANGDKQVLVIDETTSSTPLRRPAAVGDQPAGAGGCVLEPRRRLTVQGKNIDDL